MTRPAPPWWRRTHALRLARAMLRAAALLVAAPGRAAWVEEWEGELWALDQRGAGAAALLAFALGGVGDAFRESIHGHGEVGMGMITGSGLLQDLRTALRRLVRAPGFTAVTVTVLALGIGANTALFGALRAVLIGGAPYPEAERLVVVDLLLEEPEGPPDTLTWSYPKYAAIEGRMGFLSASAGYMARTVTLAGEHEPVREPIEIVSPTYFAMLGVDRAIGRTLLADDALGGDARVLVLAHHTWVERFGADPAVVGRRLTVNDEAFEIVGVAPPGFRGLTGSAAAWVPMGAAPLVMDARRLERDWSHWFQVAGRLDAGISIEEARSAAEPLGEALTAAFPHPERADVRQDVSLASLEQVRVNDTSRLAVVAVGVGAALLLAIAAANAAGLMLARMAARRGDLAVRAALGAGRGRLARETLAESLLLAGAGGIAGILLAWVGQGGVRWAITYALETSGSRSLQFLDPVGLTTTDTLPLVGLALALLTGLVFGIVPAVMASRARLVGQLASTGRGNAAARSGPADRARSVLVGGQLALTLVLLSGAGLMLASFSRLESVALGFRPEGVLTARYEVGPEASQDEVRRFEAALLERLGGLAGVESAALAVCAPLAGLCDITGVREVDGRARPEGAEPSWMHTQSVTPGFFETAGVRIVRGRGLPEGLRPEDPAQVVVSESAAATYLPGIDPIGRTIAITHSATPEGRPAEIIGVVRDVAYQELEAAPFPTLYFSSEQVPAGWGQVIVRATDDAAQLAGVVRGTVLSLRPDLPVWDVTTLEARKAAATARTRVILGLFATFGGTALLLSAVGLWGLVAYAVTRRTREMGLRMALGAGRGRILGDVAWRPVLLAGAGAVTGVVGSMLLSRYLRVLLFEVAPGDPLVHGGALALLIAVAVAAAIVPALRATRLDPSEALRAE